MPDVLTLPAADITVDHERVLRAMGYPRGDAASRAVLDGLPEWADGVVERARPRAVWRTVEVAVENGRVGVVGGPVFHGKLLARTMRPAGRVLLLLVTVGEEVSNWIRERMAQEPLAGVGADAVASELVEAAADRFEEMAARAAGHESYRTLRFSPGYCDWRVDELPALLGIVEPARIGVTLTSGGMMKPTKSIAGMVGLSNDPAAAAFKPCDYCKKDCDHRR